MSSWVSFFSVLNFHCRDLLLSCLDLLKDFLKMYYKYFSLFTFCWVCCCCCCCCYPVFFCSASVLSWQACYWHIEMLLIFVYWLFFKSCYYAKSVYSSRCFLIVFFQVLGCRIESAKSRNNSVSWFPICVPIFLSLGSWL